MTQKQFEELTKIDEKMPDPDDDTERHMKWLNKQLRKDGYDELEFISERKLKKIEDGTLKEPIENINKDVEWECDEEKEVTEEMIKKRKREWLSVTKKETTI
jgi:predicted membrane GTPase involved in stress response